MIKKYQALVRDPLGITKFKKLGEWEVTLFEDGNYKLVTPQGTIILMKNGNKKDKLAKQSNA